ncbi:phage replisome organizer N-terminal domain-containing protein [Clostridium hydrogeniformans]|nr:phage replisome organizer N-terminal domain-containing protein [Clostridium hydrogeniformans]
MAEVKWIKITTNMFDDEKIKLIDAMPERDTIHYIWIRLLVQSGKTNANGYIFLNENVPYTEEMLSTIFNRPLNSVRLALQTLSNFGMIHVQEDRLIKINNWEKHQNIEGMEKVREQNRLRKQKERDRKKQVSLPESCPKDDTSCDGHVTITQQNKNKNKNKKEELDIDKDINNNNNKIYNTEINTGSCCCDEIKNLDNAYVFRHFQKCGFMLTPLQYEEISADIELYSHQWLVDAAKEASNRGKLNYSYVKGILENWKAKGREYKPIKNQEPYKKASGFNNFDQRKYDGSDGGMTIKELEEGLLGLNKNK